MLPVVQIVADPAVAKPAAGTFVRLSMQREFISGLSYSVWSMELQTLIGGVLMPDRIVMKQLRIEGLLNELRNPSPRIDVIYLTHEAATELLPAMCEPRVPFAFAVHDVELVKKCMTTLGRSLDFKKN